MRESSNLKRVSDDELLRRLSDLVTRSRRVDADVVAHIAEVDARRLYARQGRGHSSLPSVISVRQTGG